MSVIDHWTKDSLAYVVKDVDGWFDPRVLDFYNAIRHLHLEAGVTGDLLEVGVHRGRSFLPLALMARPDEFAIAVDIFSGPPYGAGPEIVTQHAQNLGVIERIKVVKGNIEAAAERTDLVRDESCRVCSVDADHTAESTFLDIAQCCVFLKIHGVLIVDDVWNGDWPSVGEGFHRFMNDGLSLDMVPVAHAFGRTFLAKGPDFARKMRERFLGLSVKPKRDSVLYETPFLSW